MNILGGTCSRAPPFSFLYGRQQDPAIDGMKFTLLLATLCSVCIDTLNHQTVYINQLTTLGDAVLAYMHICYAICAWCVSVLKAHHHYYFISIRQPSGTTQHVSSSSGIFSNSSVDTVREAANALSQDTVAETEAQIITSNNRHFRAFGS